MTSPCLIAAKISVGECVCVSLRDFFAFQKKLFLLRRYHSIQQILTNNGRHHCRLYLLHIFYGYVLLQREYRKNGLSFPIFYFLEYVIDSFYSHYIE